MIDFRYHLVSIVAVFLALAVGIALGAGPLKDPVDVALGNQTEALREERNQLRSQVDELDARVAYDDAWSAAAADPLVRGRLLDQRVVVVQLPGAESTAADSAEGALEGAGASVTGVVTLLDDWSDPDQEAILDDLIDRLTASGGEPDEGDASAYEKAGHALGEALVSADPALIGIPSEGSAALLSALVELGVIEVTGSPEQRAGLVYVVAAEAPEDPGSEDAERARSAVLSLIRSLDSGLGSVVAGPEGSAGEGSVVRAIRDDGDLRAAVSTVDIADVASGRTSAVVALGRQANGETGHYGTGADADGAAPSFDRP
ncbi:MAG: copper transporter [Candidatus Nanopelagicales bacterium]